MSELLALGVSHKTAPLDLRERLSLTEGRAVGALQELTAAAGIHEAAVERMIASSEALIAALDAHDIQAIETTIASFGESVEQLKSSGSWQRSPGLRRAAR